MTIIIGILCAGILTGYLARNSRAVRHAEKGTAWTVPLLLFLMGLSVGGNPSLMKNLASLGGQALAIATAATLGSIAAGWGLYKLLFKTGNHEK